MNYSVTKTLLFILALLPLIHGECYVKQNSFLEISETPKSTNMKVGICGSEGWSGVVFSKTNSINDMTFGVITFITNNTRPVYTLSSHFQLKDQIPYTPHSNEKTFHYWSMNGFTISLNYTFEWNYVFFACKKSSQYFFGVPLENYHTNYNTTSQQFIFPNHNQVNVIKRTDKQQCYPYGYKVVDFTVSKEFTFFWFSNVASLIILLSLNVFFRHRAPLSTRGPIPFFALGLFIFESTNGLLYVISPSFEFVYHYGCFFSGTFYTPSRMTLIVLFVMVRKNLTKISKCNIKNLTTLYIKSHTMELYEADKDKSLQTSIVRILKYATHDFTILLAVCITYAIIFSIHAITFAYTYPKERFQCSLNLKTYFEPIYFILAFISIVFLFTEFLINFRMIYKDRCKLFWLRDPYGIRLQQGNLIFIVIFSFFAFIFYLVILFYENVEILLTSYQDVTYQSLTSFYYGFATLEYLMEINYFVGTALLFTIFRFISSLIMLKKYTSDQLKEFLENPKIFDAFKKYCEDQWDLEYILFLEDVKSFYRTNGKSKNTLATKIGKLYLSGTSSELELNVPGDISRVYLEKVSHHVRTRTDVPDESFDTILKIVYDRLMEQYMIFSQTQEYLDLGDIQELQEVKK